MHMFMLHARKVTYVCSYACLPRKVCGMSAAQWLSIEQMSLAAELDICIPVSCLPDVILIPNPSPTDFEPWLRCLTFCLLSIFAMFSTLLGLAEIKNLYNIMI